jgi:hypothetical protein
MLTAMLAKHHFLPLEVIDIFSLTGLLQIQSSQGVLSSLYLQISDFALLPYLFFSSKESSLFRSIRKGEEGKSDENIMYSCMKMEK